MKYLRKYSRILKFGIVGASGSLLGLSTLYLFTTIFGLYYIASYWLSFLLVVTSNYILNSFWTFKTPPHLFGYVKYVGASSVTVGITTGLLYLLTDKVGLWYMTSAFITTLCGFIINYSISKHFIWRFV